jgi:hypothetical protein
VQGGSGVCTQLHSLPIVSLLLWSRQGGQHAQHPCACVGLVSRSAGKCVGGQSHTSYLAAQASHCPLVIVKRAMARLMSASCVGLVAQLVENDERETTYSPSSWPLGMASSKRRCQSERCGKLAATTQAERACGGRSKGVRTRPSKEEGAVPRGC